MRNFFEYPHFLLTKLALYLAFSTLESQQAGCFVVDPSFKNMFVWGSHYRLSFVGYSNFVHLRMYFVIDELEKFSTLPKTNLAGSTTSTDFGKQMSTCKKVKLSIWKRPTIAISFIKEASKH